MEWKRDLDFRDPGFSMIDQTLLMINVYVPVGISNSECINTLWNDSS